MAKIKEREHELHATVVSRKRKEGEFCEVIVRFKDPRTEKYKTISQITDVVYNPASQTIDHVKYKYGPIVIKKAQDYLSGKKPVEEHKKLTFADYMEIYLKYRYDVHLKLTEKISNVTYINEKGFVRRIKKYFMDHPVLLSELDEQSLYEYMEYLKDKGLDSRYIRIHMDKIKKILKQAVKDRYINENPVDYMELPPKGEYIDNRILSLDQMRTLLERVKNDVCAPYVYLICYTGCRTAEVTGISWDSIDLTLNRMDIVQAAKHELPKEERIEKRLKSKKSYRNLKICDALKIKLIELREKQEKDREFYGSDYKDPVGNVILRADNGVMLNPRTWYDRYRRFMSEQADIPYVTPRGLRKSYTNIMHDILAEANIFDPYTESEVIGHTRTVHETNYLQSNQSRADKAIDMTGESLTDNTN